MLGTIPKYIYLQLRLLGGRISPQSADRCIALIYLTEPKQNQNTTRFCDGTTETHESQSNTFHLFRKPDKRNTDCIELQELVEQQPPRR